MLSETYFPELTVNRKSSARKEIAGKTAGHTHSFNRGVLLLPKTDIGESVLSFWRRRSSKTNSLIMSRALNVSNELIITAKKCVRLQGKQRRECQVIFCPFIFLRLLIYKLYPSAAKLTTRWWVMSSIWNCELW